MPSYLLHGENHPESRKRLSELVSQAEEKGWEIIRVDGQKEEKIDLNLLSHTSFMFGLGRCLVVENLFSFNKKALQTVKELLANPDSGTSFIFWEPKIIAWQTTQALAEYLKIEEYKIPKALFKFLESIAPGNAEYALKLLQNAKRQNSADMLLIMLARQIRLLYCLLVDDKNLKLADWQKRNLGQQAKKFTPRQLLDLHHRLLELDRKNKKSQLPEDLSASLDLLVANL